MTTYDVVVTWMDGQQETYRAIRAFVESGVLKIEPVGTSFPVTVRYVPLATMRIFTVEEVSY